MKPTTCTFDPRMINGSVGMLHWPECGEMQLAGYGHTMQWEAEDWQVCWDSLNKKTRIDELEEDMF